MFEYIIDYEHIPYKIIILNIDTYKIIKYYSTHYTYLSRVLIVKYIRFFPNRWRWIIFNI